MNTIISPHDKFFKLSLQEKQIAQDFFQHHLPQSLQDQMDLHTLHLESENFIDEQEQAHFSDVLYSVKINNKPGYLFILAEHQSSPDRTMTHYLFKGFFGTIAYHLLST